MMNKLKNIFKIKWVPFWLVFITITLVKVGVAFPFILENIYSQFFYPVWAKIFSFLSGHIPFSVWDSFWIIVVLWLIIGIIRLLIQRNRIKRRVLRFFQVLALIYSIFYWSWGFNYFRPSLPQRQDWKAVTEPNSDSLFRAQLLFLVEQVNIMAEVEKEQDREIVIEAIDKSYASIAKEYGLDPFRGKKKPKPMLFARWFAASGVSGYFGPFFNEVHVNQLSLPVEYPFTLAHEIAHQFGITSEAEANFFAWIVCSNSESLAVQYSGNLMLLRYFLFDAQRLDDIKEIVQRISPDVKGDFIAISEHWQSLRIQKLDEFQTKANNLYLKSNGVKGGTRDYNRVVKLVLQWKQSQETVDRKR